VSVCWHCDPRRHRECVSAIETRESGLNPAPPSPSLTVDCRGRRTPQKRPPDHVSAGSVHRCVYFFRDGQGGGGEREEGAAGGLHRYAEWRETDAVGRGCHGLPCIAMQNGGTLTRSGGPVSGYSRLRTEHTGCPVQAVAAEASLCRMEGPSGVSAGRL
jgi:hypothetical protein